MKRFVSEHETPYYVYDTDVMSKKIEWIRKNIKPDVKICYSMKANSFILGTVKDSVDKIEVCSFGEYQICKKNKIPFEKLIISGVVKKKEELEEILTECKELPVYTVESENQFYLINDWAEKKHIKVHVLIRLSAHTQFGIDKETAVKICCYAQNNHYILLDGIHFFTGTKKRSVDKNVAELKKLDEEILEIEEKSGFKFKKLEYGLGMDVPYFTGNENEYYKEKDWDKLNTALEIFERYEITIEMGRALTAECGYYFSEVIDTKMSDGVNYAMIEGGMNQLHYDGQIRGMYIPFIQKIDGSLKDKIENHNSDKDWNICGSLCTANDIIAAKCRFDDLKPGDVLVFKNVGAYSAMEGMTLFLSHEIPAVYSYSLASGEKILRAKKETFILNCE